MPFVLDACVTLAWCFEDEGSGYADAVLGSLEADTALVPPVWPLEVANGLSVAERRGRLGSADVSRFVELLPALPITVEEASLARALGPILDLARSEGLSSYDASYLELAMREGLPLATLDTKIKAAAARLKVAVFQWPPRKRPKRGSDRAV
ncbi:MAG: type II toxin-antitoxin system VapC family toxin [Actinomycetota bacterium]